MKQLIQSIRKKFQRGFTLVELVIVIAVIAVLAAVLIPTFITVIDDANNSADVQLAANLNTTLAGQWQINSDTVASAQNIRHAAKEIADIDADDLVTKKADNVIAFSKKENRFVALDVSKITGEQLVPGYYAEEVIKDYIIVSTSGNDLAEALYHLSNLPSETELAASTSMSSPSSSADAVNMSEVLLSSTPSERLGTYVGNALNAIRNSEIRSVVTSIVNSTLYVNKDGNMFFVSVDNDKVEAQQITKADIPTYPTAPGNIVDKTAGRVRTRVVFSEDVTTFNVENLAVEKSALNVIVPQNVELTGTIDASATEIPKFSGNVGSVVPSKFVGSVESTKERIETNDMETIILYNASQVYTSDFSGSFSEALKMAAKLHDIKEKYPDNETIQQGDYSTIRLIVNSNVTISGTVEIPAYVDVQIPFAIGNSAAKAIMEYTMGNMLANKALGSAYPANDAENLGKENNNQLYYLCGEGPGNGSDVMLHNYLLGLSSAELPEGYDETETIKIFEASRNISTKEAEYSLTIESNATLNIVGNLTVGGVIGYPNAGGYQGHTSGAHGQIDNEGTINVQKGGVLDVFGFVDGNGKVDAKEGGLVFEPFMVTDYLDTMNTLFLYPFCGFPTGNSKPDTDNTTFNSPFMRYAVSNIRTELTLEYGSSLYGRANLMVFGGFLYCRANAPLITSNNYIYDTFKGEYMPIDTFKGDEDWHTNADGSDDTDNGTYFKNTDTTRYMATICGALQLTDKSSSIVCTYDGEKAITISSDNSESYEYQEVCNRNCYAGDIGVVTLALNGDISTSGIKMDLLGGTVNIAGYPLDFRNAAVPVDTSWCDLPVPYNFNFKVNGDLTVAEDNKFVFMPGTVFTVAQTGTVTIKHGAGLYALEAYEDSDFLKNWGNYLLGGSVQGMIKDENDGYYYNSKLNQSKPSGTYEVTDILLLILGSMQTFAPKYYPSAKLLTNNQFSSSAQFIVEGKIIVEEGGDLGGKITAKDSSTITLNKGAGMGKVLNLGGPYEGKASFFTMVVGRELEDEDGNGGMSMTITGMAGLPLEFLSSVSVTCYLNVVNSKGKEIAFTETDDYTVLQREQEVLFWDINKGDKYTFSGCESTFMKGEVNYRDKTLKISSDYRTAAREIVINDTSLQGAALEHSANTKIAYFSFDSTGKTITLKDFAKAE